MSENMVKEINEFISQLTPGQLALGLFQELPGVIFWVKDMEGRFVFVNQAFKEVLWLQGEDILGKTDKDIYANDLAEVFMEDDVNIRTTGQAIRQKVELVTRRHGGVEWRTASKIPLRNFEGEIVGTAGISRKIEQAGSMMPSHRALDIVIQYVHDNVGKGLKVGEMAREMGVSVATLERRFKEYLGTSPSKFIQKARIARACELLLQTQMAIGEVAEKTGFVEHASFTRAFEKMMRMTPSSYRKCYGGN